MRLLIAFFVFSQVALGAATQVTASGGSPIPASYSTSDSQSKVQECSGNVVEVLNQTGTVLAVGFGTTSNVPSFNYLFVPPGPNSGHSFKPSGGVSSGTYIYIKSAGSAITSGTVQVSCYYEEK